jgi:ABC-type Fe3+/spermidine/putrescine transport system ATPase subunit
MQSAVVLRNVTKSFGRRTVVDDFSLDVPHGSTLGIIGPSGSGKTTLLRLVAGLEIPDEGQIRVGGRLASSAGRLLVPPSHRNVGFVFQDLALWPHMTVAGNLLFVLEARGWPRATRKERVEQMLAIVGMRDRAREYPTHLSGGEQQRVALARAIAAAPDLLLLDEPLSSLDPDLRADLRNQLAAITRTLAVTMMYVTHDRADLAAFGGTAVVMKQGRAQPR